MILKYNRFFALTTLLLAGCLTQNLHASGRTKKEDRKLIDKVAAWQIANFPEVKHFAKFPGVEHHDKDWTKGTFYLGLAEWAEYTRNDSYYDFLMNIGKKNDWGFLRNVTIYYADNLCVAQMYLALHRKYKQPEMIDRTRERVGYIVENPSSVPLWHGVKGGLERWSWCDALFMAPPVFVGLYQVDKDPRLLEFLDSEYKLAADSLYSPKDGLFFRDRIYKYKTEKNGKPIFWCRGNGWVLCGLAQMLQYLPKDHSSYTYYERIFREMADAVVRCQDGKGSWHAGLYDPDSYPLAENSGSSFFVYGLAWGVNHGVLKDSKYRDAAIRGWEALKGYVDEDGKLGCVQQIGMGPGEYTPESTQIYAVGAFLLAGRQMMKISY